MERVHRSPARTPFGLVQGARLVVSYQRYAALLFGVVALAAWLGLGAEVLWARVSAGALVLGVGWFATMVALRLPHKLRLTRTQDARIARGKFDPDDLLLWVEDPCYRVVAREILVRAGRSASESRAEVAALARRAAAHEGSVIYTRPPSLDGAHPLDPLKETT